MKFQPGMRPEFVVYWFKLNRDGLTPITVMAISQNYDRERAAFNDAIPCPYQALAEEYGYVSWVADKQTTQRIKDEFLAEHPYDAIQRANRLARQIIPYSGYAH